MDDTAQPAAKLQKIAKEDESLESRNSSLEKKLDDTVTQLKDQVRSTAPSEPLILLTLEELSRVSRTQGYVDVEIYEELARQAKVN